MKTVLAPLDGSKLAEETLLRGLPEENKDSLEVILLHCIDLNELVLRASTSPANRVVELMETEGERWRKYLETHVQLLVERGYKARAQVEIANPVNGILWYVHKHKPDLVVLTSHGRTGLSRFLMGSVAEGVVRRCECPMMVIPSSIRHSYSETDLDPARAVC